MGAGNQIIFSYLVLKPYINGNHIRDYLKSGKGS